MKSSKHSTLLSKLNQLRGELNFLAQPESKEEFVNSLAELISSLRSLKDGLTDPSLSARSSDVIQPLDQVISFLESASSDAALRALLSSGRKGGQPKAKRLPIDIPQNLSNEQIRSLLEKKLSRVELKAIASQRGISIGKSNSDTIKQDILKNLDRQEGYERLAAS